MKTKPVSLLILICSLSTHALIAGNPYSSQPPKTYKTEANDCNVPTARAVLDINNVRASLLTAGDMWFNTTTANASYEVPKGNPTTGTSYPQAIFAGSIWISGLDAGNNLKIAAETYRSQGVDFFSGPLDNAGNTALTTCNLWDSHFPVWATQIQPVLAAYQNALNAGGTPGNITIPMTAIADSVKYWPGKGNPYLAALGYDMSSVLAPFYDADGNGTYDPGHGDYPTIRHGGISPGMLGGCGSDFDSAAFANSSAFADQMIFWVMNDKGNLHSGSSGGAAIGVQINSLAFAFQTNDAINDMTFYRYHVVNKSGAVLNKTYISQFTDPDLGCPNNDAVGCDTSRNLAFVYNGVYAGSTNGPGGYVCDNGSACHNGAVGYGCDLGVLGIQFLETPADTVLDPVSGRPKQLGMTAFSSFTFGSAPGPFPTQTYRNYQTSIMPDGSHLTFGNRPINFEYPGDPSIATEWSECNPQSGGTIYAGERRFVQTAGPFTFMPCASQYLTVVVTYTSPVNTNCPGFGAMAPAADRAIDFFNDGLRLPNHTAVNTVDADQISIYPNPVSSDLIFDVRGGSQVDQVTVYDLTGRVVMTKMGHTISLDMSKLPEGIYLVRTKAGNKETTQKIAKR